MAKLLTEGSPARLIWGFTFPLLAGNIFQQMYAFVDTLLVGRFLGVEALAAVGCTGGLMFLLMGFVLGTATGLSLYTGQRYGARDMAGVRKSAAACFLLAAAIGATVAGISVFLARPVLLLMQTPPEILDDAVTFIRIIGANAPFLMLFSMQANLIRALGDSRTPALLLALGLTLNIVFEPLFILGLDFGVRGAALATAASQVAANVFALWYIRCHVPALWPQRQDWRCSLRMLRQHLRLGLPMGFQGSVIALGAIILQVPLNHLGPVAVAAYSAAQKVDTIGVMPMMSFGMAMAAYTAQNYGAGQFERIRAGVRAGILMSGSFSIAVGLLMYFCGEAIISLFVGPEETQVISYGHLYLALDGAFYFLLSLLFVFRFTLQGLGQTFVPTLAGFMELLMRAGAAFFLIDRFGFLGACLANPLAWLGACLPLVPAYVWIRRTLQEPQGKEKAV